MDRSSLNDGATDAALVARIARGDRDALAELYERHSTWLFRYALRIVRDRGEAEDLLHDVFLEAWRVAASFEPARGSVRGWLLVRMRSRAVDRVRSARVRCHDASVAVDTVADGASCTIDQALVRRAVGEVPHERGELLRLAFVGGLTMSELAAQLGIPIGTVKSRMAANLASVRRAMWRAQPACNSR